MSLGKASDRKRIEFELHSLIRREGWNVAVGTLHWNTKPYFYVGLYDAEGTYYPIDKVPAADKVSADIKTKIMLIAG